MTKLQQIVKKAQQLRKQYPKKYSKWTDYIKAASKQVAGFEGVIRSGNKTTVKYSRAEKPAAKKKAAAKKGAPVKAVQKTLFGVKKATVKNVELAKLYYKALKSIPGSERQKKIIVQIEALKDKGYKLAGTHKDTKSHNVNIRVMNGMYKLSGVEPHVAKYFIEWTYDGIKQKKYYDKMPKDVYRSFDGIYYMMVLTDKGTSLTALYSTKTNKMIRRK